MSFIKARAPAYGVKPSIFARKDIHVHLPEGAVPKDGPSAGVGMVTAMVSTLTGIPVRRDVAMTGEVTLRGRVLPIGGLKEKLLAALRGGITTVLIPAENEKDLVEIPASVNEALEIIPVGPCRRGAGAGADPANSSRSNGPMPTSMRPNPWSIPTVRRKVPPFVISPFDLGGENGVKARFVCVREFRGERVE